MDNQPTMKPEEVPTPSSSDGNHIPLVEQNSTNESNEAAIHTNKYFLPVGLIVMAGLVGGLLFYILSMSNDPYAKGPLPPPSIDTIPNPPESLGNDDDKSGGRRFDTPPALVQGDDNTVTVRSQNFTFVNADGWDVSNETSLPYMDIGTTEFVVANEESKCVLSYHTIPTDEFEEAYTLDYQGDTKNFYAKNQSISFLDLVTGFDDLGATKAALYDVTRRWDYSTDIRKVFILSSQFDELPEQCVTESASMLQSLELDFANVQLTDASNGHIYLLDYQEYRDEGRRSDHHIALVFRDTNGKTNALYEFDVAPFEVVVKDTKIYAAGRDGVSVLDPYTGSYTVLPGTTPSEEHMVAGMTFVGTDLYYLEGEGCVQFDGLCNAMLYKYNLETKSSSLVSSDMGSGRILGYDPGTNTLAFVNGKGDAGCESKKVQIFDFSTKTLSEEEDFGGCYENVLQANGTYTSVEPESLTQYYALEATYIQQGGSQEVVEVHDGTLRAPTTDVGVDMTYEISVY